jgi:phosphoglycerate dehydrogenase-like enzyme
MANPPHDVTVLITSYLEPEHVDRIAAAGVRVLFDPELVAPPRFAGDHSGRPGFRRTPDQEATYRDWLATADVHFDLDADLAPAFPTLAPRLRWIQATSSGIGPLVRRTGLDRSGVTITNAAGIHAVPLAEHALLALLYFVKDVPFRLREQRAHAWERYSGRELRGMTTTVVGLGAVGLEVARTLRSVGMRVIGVRRSALAAEEATRVDEATTPAHLREVLPRSDALVLIAPHTRETEGMIGATELSLLPPGAIVVNLARGALIDEGALIEALRHGSLGGAALDVAAVEPLPADSPLWDLPHVLITPHSAATVARENERLTDLFVDNLGRYRAGEPLRNLLQL